MLGTSNSESMPVIVDFAEQGQRMYQSLKLMAIPYIAGGRPCAQAFHSASCECWFPLGLSQPLWISEVDFSSQKARR